MFKKTGLLWLLFCSIFFLSVNTSWAKSVNEKILDILLESKIVSQEKYQELKKEVEAEDAEVAKLRAAAEKKSTEGAKVDFKRGLTIESADGENKVRFSGRLHADYKQYLGDNPNSDSFFIRRARLAGIGTLYKYYDFMVEADFGQGSARLNDAFLNIRYVPYAQFMFGQFKVPFLMEELHSDNWIDFVERSLADNWAPSRDMGMMIHGNIAKDLLYYQLGVFNGVKLNTAGDVDDQKDLAGRITLAPFSRLDNEFLKDFHIGGAFTTGIEHTAKPSTDWWKNAFKTAAGTTFMQFQDTVVQDGNRTRLGGELAWLVGPVSLKGEYVTLQLNDLRNGTKTGSFSGNAGYASLGWFLTGEHEPWRNGLPQQISPKKPFVFGKGGYGAFQLLARYEWLDMDKGLLDKGFVDAAKYTNRASGYTFGLNWYPNDIFRIMVNYCRTNFDQKIDVSGKKMDSEEAILARFEIVW